MPPRRTHNHAWSLRSPLAELNSGQLSARIDASRPDLGATQVQQSGLTLAGSMLAVARDDETAKHGQTWPLSLAEVYARGEDLIASYSPRDDWPFSPQIYWRAAAVESPETLDTLALLVSVQTHLLDTRPCIRVASRFEAAEALLIERCNDGRDLIRDLDRADRTFVPTGNASIVVIRLAAADYSYVEFMPASDFQEAAVRWMETGVCETSWRLFADFLEKGVIWRARLHSLFVRRANDVEVATRVSRAMDERPLPLTA